MFVKMIQHLGSTGSPRDPGDVHECDDAEGARLIKAGLAVPHDIKQPERTTRKGPAEAR